MRKATLQNDCGPLSIAPSAHPDSVTPGTQARLGSPRGQRHQRPRHIGITAGTDTIADRERHRGLHPVPHDRLLAPGTDDLERRDDRRRVHAWLGCMRRMSLVFHRCAPSPRAIDRTTPHRSRPCALSERQTAAHQGKLTCDRRITAGADPMTLIGTGPGAGMLCQRMRF
jgi:hypothetical protein